jgi:hypothetical protein
MFTTGNYNPQTAICQERIAHLFYIRKSAATRQGAAARDYLGEQRLYSSPQVWYNM